MILERSNSAETSSPSGGDIGLHLVIDMACVKWLEDQLFFLFFFEKSYYSLFLSFSNCLQISICNQAGAVLIMLHVDYVVYVLSKVDSKIYKCCLKGIKDLVS